MNLKLRHKSLVLISVPIIYSSIFVVVFISVCDSLSKANSSETMHAYISMVKSFILGGLFLNGALTICLALFFSRSLESSISTIQSNIRKIKASEELASPIERTDELGQLDAEVHRLATALKEKQ